MILVDCNIIIDILAKDPSWQVWSEAALSDAADRGEVAINPIIFGEIASGFATMSDLDRTWAQTCSEGWRFPMRPDLSRAGRLWSHRRRCGVRTSPLLDFYIGAHAAVSGLNLLTCDARRYAGYFPTVRLISPE